MDIKLREILNKVKDGKMQPDEAQWKICVLFNVGGEVVAVCRLKREPQKCQDYLNGIKCKNCNNYITHK